MPGEFDRAQDYLQDALAIGRQAQEYDSISAILTNLGVLAVKCGNLGEAKSYLQEGLALAYELDGSEKISGLFSNLGGLAACRGDYAPGVIALYGLARVAAAEGDNERACQQGEESLIAFQEIGHHKAAEVEDWLDSLVV